MSEFSVRIWRRDGSTVHIPAGLTLEPRQWDADAVGGPSSAEVSARGDVLRLAELGNWLGNTLWIVAPNGEIVWWGDVEEVALSHQGTTIGVTLDECANRLQVLYTDDSPGGEMGSEETEWAEDAESVTRYGLRERKHTARNPMRAAQAVQMRDTLLGRVSRPAALVGQVGSEGEAAAMLRCTGFWRRLERVYYANDNGLVEYVEGSIAWPLGLGFTSTKAAASSRDGTYRIGEIDGKFLHFTAPDLQVRVAGSASNNGTYRVTGADEREAETLTSSTIFFTVNDDIEDTAAGLTPFEQGDLITVAGSTANSGTHLVKTPGSVRIEISPAYAGDSIEDETAGPSITLARGNHIEVGQSVVNEHCGASWTVTAHGQMIAQSFVTGTSGDWAARSVEIKVRKMGAPADNVQVRLFTDNAGAPGTWVATATISAADVTGDESGRWQSAEFDVDATLDNGAVYWLVIARVGANDALNFFEVWLDAEAGYADGTLHLWDGAAWQAPVEPMSLLFRLRGAVDTAQQVVAMVTVPGALVGALARESSGLETCQYRDGMLFAAEEAAELLDTGDGSNVRLIATVNPEKGAIVRQQPAQSSAQYIWRRGELFGLQGRKVTLGLLPVGEWCHLDAPALLQGALADASPFFVEYASYAPESGWSLRAAGEPDPWRIGEMRDG